ncbi:MAG: CPBP family glutamic-type intramembrane protease [Thermoleophilia bacterium]|nr:CPBP family glutamic-type intramembrane protease [Thermoleophilia bacterium]
MSGDGVVSGDATAADGALTAAPGPGDVPRRRLLGWFTLVGVLAALSYAVNLSEAGDPPTDLLYRWSSAIGAIVQYAIILGVVLLLARGLPRVVLGWQRPRSWPRAAGLVAAGYVTILVVGFVLNLFLKAGEEQGLVPDAWDPNRAWPFVANFLVVVTVAPVVEELAYRGVGFAAVRSAWGSTAAIVVTAIAFGMAHGLIVALPVLTAFGLVLAVVRQRTESVFPSIALHAVFNGVALLAAVTIAHNGG